MKLPAASSDVSLCLSNFIAASSGELNLFLINGRENFHLPLILSLREYFFRWRIGNEKYYKRKQGVRLFTRLSKDECKRWKNFHVT